MQTVALYSCRLDHCERVKWYAPHVRHLVLDIHVQQSRLNVQRQEA